MQRVGNPTQAVVGLLIAALCAGALLTIGLVVFGPEVSETNSHIALTVFALGFASVTGVAGSNLARLRALHSPFGYLTVVVSLVAFVIAVNTIWSAEGLLGGDKLIFYALVLAFATGHASYFLYSAEESDTNAVRWISLATLLPLTTLVVMAFINLSAGRGEVGPNPIGVAVVLYALGVILLPLTRRYAAS
ncbi:MAG TPA: hypothetical protein VLL27_04270 [Solirubrobacterales bacterium]|nr:hypothetical protein [Solirubrobacterales bacterium]